MLSLLEKYASSLLPLFITLQFLFGSTLGSDSGILLPRLSGLHRINGRILKMLPGGPRPFLVKPSAGQTAEAVTFCTDEMVRQSGIYRVRHSSHRVPHEVTLLRDEYFPRCAKCDTAVIFELVRAVQDESETAISPRICLYELPVLEDDGPREDETPVASWDKAGSRCSS
jgi:hypothetical protein